MSPISGQIQLRTHLESIDQFVTQINERQRPACYRLIASFEGDQVAAVAGFRTGHSLSWGRFCYVDDRVTGKAFRGRGHATRVLSWIREETRRLDCGQVHLDSGTQRHDAHCLYLRSGYRITAFHFVGDVD